MTLQRQVNPLPPGRYWLDVFDKPEGQITAFTDWARDSGKLVHVEQTEEHPADGATPKRLFTIFRVSEPGAVFSSEQFGFPNIATDDVKFSDDTAHIPDVDPVPSGASVLKIALVVGAAALVVGGVVLLMSKRSKGTQVVLVPGPALG